MATVWWDAFKVEKDGKLYCWEVRYRINGSGDKRKRTSPKTGKPFKTQNEAKAWGASMATRAMDGSYIPAEAGRGMFESYAWKYCESRTDWSQASKDRAAQLMRTHIVPRWGERTLGEIKPSDMETWFAQVVAATSVGTAKRLKPIVSGTFDMALRDRLITGPNPCAQVRLKESKPAEEGRSATHTEVANLVRVLRNTPPRVWRAARNPSRAEQDKLAADTAMDRVAGAKRAALVLVLVYCGPRWGEAIGLLRQDIDSERHQIHIRGGWTDTTKGWIWGTTKGGRPRTVPMPGIVERALQEHLDRQKRVDRTLPDGQHGDLVFPADRSGLLMRNQNARRGWLDQAAADAGLPVGWHPHEFRHAAGSFALDVAPVKEAQHLLGHRQTATTTDRYGHRLRSGSDLLRRALDEAIELSARAN